MRSLLTFLALWDILSLPAATIETGLSKRQDANTTLAAPIVAESSQHWEGKDGTWSTFTIRLGTPPSTYRILPATSWQETWVIYGVAAGVCNTSAGVEKDCQEERGGVFDTAKSSTWKKGEQYQLGLGGELGMSGVGQYGFDTVGLGYTNLTGPTLPNQIVSAIVSDDFWFGIFGLGFQPTNFTGYDDPQPSFTDTLYTSGEIASRSWSYTAGAYYRLKSVFGSLIFGGYDASRFTPNDVIFTMTDDNLRDIVVTIRSITSDTESGSATLLEEPEFAFIDSAVPELWLPVSVCEAFERTFGLELDEPSGMYLLNESAHTKLQDLNPNITFTLANQKSGGETTDIVFPYAAFDLNVSAPIVNNKTEWYFPIRRGEEGKYTLGRTFLQEAYVTTHYESRTFNVSQCVFEDGGKSHIIALPAVLSTESEDSGSGSGSGSETASGKKKKLGTGAIVGIVIGILALFLILGLLVFLCLRRRKRRSKMEEVASAHDDAIEIDTGKRLEKPGAGGRWTTAYGEQASSFTNEVPGNDAKVEIEGNPIMIPQELEADVPSTSSQQNNTMPGHGRTPMAELNAEQRGLGSGVAGGRDRDVDLVSPNTETYRSSVVGRDGPSIAVSTPTGSEGNWTPSTPIQRGGTGGSRFRERLSEDKPAG